jgi:hypothetical protein
MSPSFISGRFSWSTNACCERANQDSATVPLCDDACECQGCSQFGFTFHYEGYKLSFAGIDCGCKEKVHGESTQDGAFLNVSFSHSALFYEEAYTNAPGDVVGKRVSTNVTITCTAKGGLHGGVLNLTRSGFDKLLFVSGDQISEGSITLAPNETRVWEGVYVPLTHSEVKDDVSVAASFNEYVSGEFLLEEEKLTVVKLELEPLVNIDGLSNRHVVGVGEEIICRICPNISSWSINVFTNLLWPDEFNEIRFLCPYFGANSSVIFSIIGTENYFTSYLKVIEPSGVAVKHAREILYPNAFVSQAGWAGMMLDLIVLPTNVCFSAIFIMEVPEESAGIAPTGYFTNSVFSAVWHHTVEMGAGMWYRVQRDNHFLEDYAECGEGLPAGWGNGEIKWEIPTAWGYKSLGGEDYVSKVFGMPYYQVFTLNDSGDFRVSKFNKYWVERSPNGLRRRSKDVKEGVTTNGGS